MTLLLTCEHAVNTIPDRYVNRFANAQEILNSHRGIDIGARTLAEGLSQALQVPLFAGQVSRLLIELNRSVDHNQLFSEFTCPLSESEKQELLNQYYYPYRNQIERWIEEAPKPVLHVSVHSFTPVWNGITRTVDIGLLFDPERKLESLCCRHLQEKLTHALPSLQIFFNEPYGGFDDGFTTYLRTRFSDEHYAGIEIEMNQKYSDTDDFHRIQSALIQALKIMR